MSKATIQLFMARTWQRGIREAWTALEGGESVDGLRDRLVTLERQLADITPTLETRGHREMMRDLSDAVEQVAEGSKACTEATNADPRTVPERRYDLGGVNEDGWPDATSIHAAMHELSQRWCFTLFGSPCGIYQRTARRYTRTTDEDGIECWVKRES